ncbi:MAG: hypothetical protein CMD09_04790 [Flavobacteriales bacterium]|nr:hypothetical protein [Flavobacteriales bacterium]
MSEIREIKLREINVPEIPNWAINVPESIPVFSPVTQQIITGQIGFPVMDVPGCVEARETSNNDNLVIDAENTNLLLCDPGQQPSFTPMDYSPDSTPPVAKNVMLPPPLDQPKSESKSTNNNNISDGVIDPTGGPQLPAPRTPNPCPRPDDPPIGSKGKFGTARVESYYRDATGECKIKWTAEKPQDVAFTYLPPPPVALTTAAIAATAVTSSVLIKPLSDALLKIVKPITKKVVKKVLSRLGKKPKVLSVRERRLEQKALKK